MKNFAANSYLVPLVLTLNLLSASKARADGPDPKGVVEEECKLVRTQLHGYSVALRDALFEQTMVTEEDRKKEALLQDGLKDDVTEEEQQRYWDLREEANQKHELRNTIRRLEREIDIQNFTRKFDRSIADCIGSKNVSDCVRQAIETAISDAEFRSCSDMEAEGIQDACKVADENIKNRGLQIFDANMCVPAAEEDLQALKGLSGTLKRLGWSPRKILSNWGQAYGSPTVLVKSGKLLPPIAKTKRLTAQEVKLKALQIRLRDVGSKAIKIISR